MTNPNHFADTLFLTPYKSETKATMTNPYPPQTARWWFFEYLPEPYRGRAIANFTEEEDYADTSIANALQGAFVWMNTAEGESYWRDLQTRSRNGEFSTPNTHEPTAEQIQSATESFAGVETDTYMNEVRGRDNLNTYTIQTSQFSATVIAADQQGAMDILFKYMLNCAAFTFRFDRSNIVAGSSDVPEGAKAGILEYEKL